MEVFSTYPSAPREFLRSFPRAWSIHNENETEVTLRIRHDSREKKNQRHNYGKAVGNKKAEKES